MLTPRNYISFSQMTLFEMSPEKYISKYIYGEKDRVSRNMKYGSMLAEGLEFEEANGDPLLDLMASRLPKFELMDKPIEADLKDGKGVIRLLAKPDSLSITCPSCGYICENMAYLLHEKQKRTIYKGSFSAERVEDENANVGRNKNENKFSKQGTTVLEQRKETTLYSLEQRNERNNESMEQGKKVFGGIEKENEYFQERETTSYVKGNKNENRSRKLERENTGTSEIAKSDRIFRVEAKGIQKGQLDLSDLQKKGRKATSGSYKTIRSLSETQIKAEQRTNALQGLSQKNTDISKWNEPCKTCHGKPYIRILEYKTSTRKWTQKMVNDSGQITFYATAIWLKTGKIPQDIELVAIQTEYAEDGSLRPTGELWCYPTKRIMSDIIKMTGRIRKAWYGIKELCEKELL